MATQAMQASLDVQSSTSTVKFINYVDSHSRNYPGINGLGQQCRYIPYVLLRKYWTRNEISKVLQKHGISVETTVVEEDIALFSMLVYKQVVAYYHQLVAHNIREHYFPFSSPVLPAPFDTKGHSDFCNMLRSSQWLFFPVRPNHDTFSDTELQPQKIWPFEGGSKRLLKENKNEGTKIFRVTVDPDSYDPCNANGIPRHMVIKTYTKRSYYLNERKLFILLKEQNKTNEHIIGYYGSFQQNDTYNLMLELANFHSLADYLAKVRRPANLAEIQLFWVSMSGLLIGLQGVHQISISDGNHEESKYSGAHEDIKPDNILLSKKSSASDYEFIAKLADFGLSDVQLVEAHDGTQMIRDLHGNQYWSAPEASHHRAFHTDDRWYTHKADIFSLGCIFSVCAVWLAFGNDGIREYHDLRVHGQSDLDPGKKGLRGCFHNGVDRLPAVGQMHDRVIAYCNSFNDTITPRLLQVVEEDMLVDKRKRDDPKSIYEKFYNIFHLSTPPSDNTLPPVTRPVPHLSLDTGGSLSADLPIDGYPRRQSAPCMELPFRSIHSTGATDQPSSAQQAGPYPSPSSITLLPVAPSTPRIQVTPSESFSFPDRNPQAPMSMPEQTSPQRRFFEVSSPTERARRPSVERTPSNITVRQARDWIKAKKSRGQLSVNSDTDRAVHKIFETVSHRNYLFFIDDTETMCQYKAEVDHLFYTLAHIAKRMDPEGGVELAFASDFGKGAPPRVYEEKHATPLLRALLKCNYDQDVEYTERSMGCLVQRILLKLNGDGSRRASWLSSSKKHPISIFIFTDGCWDLTNVEPKAAGVEDPFIRLVKAVKDSPFGRDHVMVQFIRFGDDEHGKRRLEYLDDLGKGAPYECDIIDTKPATGYINSMFTGSITRANDRVGESER